MDITTVGAILYWCEGSKREDDRRVEFVNSDPRMISVFMKYLRTKDIDEARIRARMTIHVQDEERECKDYWKSVTSLKDTNFISTVVKSPSFSKKPLRYGNIAIRYNSLQLLRQIKEEISNLAEEISETLPQKPV
ncbi:MAG TPA: hypothetical protein VGS04_04025 [Nitrososphaerales archaeon]|nr:hypothetical protein [Nitrososphaerales archaeon]